MSILQVGGITKEESDRESQYLKSADVEPDLFDGSASLGNAWGIGASKLARGIAVAGSVAPVAYDYLFDDDTKAQDWYFKNVVDDPYNSAKEYYNTDARHMGTATQVLSGVVEMLPQLVGGGASLTGSAYLNAAVDAVNQGVDSGTAQGVGAIQGIAAGVGMMLPVVGKTLANRVVGNALINPVVGMVSRGATGQALEAGGYDAQAAQYEVMNAQSIAIDAISGAVFGAVSRPMPEAGNFKNLIGVEYSRLPTRMQDAIATARSYMHRVHDSLPGMPKNLKSQMAHIDAIDTATSQLSRGEAVRISDKVEGAEFGARNIREMDTRAIDDNAEAVEWVDDVELARPEVVREIEVKRGRPKKYPDEVAQVESDPDVMVMKQMVNDHGDFDIEFARTVDPMTGEVSVQKMKASEVIAETERRYKDDVEIAEAVKVAANCYMGTGE